MRREIKRGWLWAGLALVVTFTGSHVAQAKGIVVTSGNTQPIGDPLYNYIFDVQLNPQTTLLNGGYFTVYDLPGVTSTSIPARLTLSGVTRYKPQESPRRCSSRPSRPRSIILERHLGLPWVLDREQLDDPKPRSRRISSRDDDSVAFSADTHTDLRGDLGRDDRYD